MCLLPDVRPPQHQHPEQSMGVPAAVVARRCRMPAAASKPVMIGRPQPKQIAEASRPNRVVRRTRTHSRRPDSDEPQYFPHVCNNCGLSFVPKGVVSEFCGGECRHSFAFMRHMERRKLAQQQLRRQQLRQQQQQQQQQRQHEQQQQQLQQPQQQQRQG